MLKILKIIWKDYIRTLYGKIILKFLWKEILEGARYHSWASASGLISDSRPPELYCSALLCATLEVSRLANNF